MRNKLLFLLITVFLLSFSFVSAVDLTNPAGYWSWDDGFGDDTGNIINATVLGTDVTRTSTDCKLNDCVDSSVAGASNQLDLNFVPSSGSYSLSTWCKWDAFTVSAQDQCLSTWTGVDGGFYLGYDGSNMVMNVRQDSSWVIQYSDTGISTGQWYFITLTFDASGKEIKYYRDGSLLATSSAISTFSYPNANITLMGQPGSTTRSMNGRVDEMSYYTDVLSLTEHQELYNSGAGYNPTTANVSINDSTESTAVVKQSGTVSFAAAMTTILSSDFNVSVNNTPLYGGYSFNVFSNSVTDLYCELLIDGVVRANISRSQDPLSTGSAFIQTNDFLIEEGSHTQVLQCQRTSGIGQITVSDAVGIGHFLINQDGLFIPYNSTTFDSVSVTSGNSFTLLDSFNLTIGNYSEVDVSQNRTNYIVVESKITYSNLGLIDEVLTAYVDINGSTNCSFYPRYVSALSTGSVSMDCFLANVTENQTYTMNIYANGSNAEYTSNTIAKNFFLSEGEIIGGTGLFVGLNFTGDSFTPLAVPTSAGNLNHDVANVFTKLSYSILTDLDTTVEIYFNLTNGDEYQTVVWERDFIAGETGVIIGHDILEDVAKDANYTVQVYANCGTVGANCTIVGGQTGGYITDVVTTFLNAFNVSAFDYWDNSSIFNFTVVDGGTWTTTTGSVLVFTENNPENLTVTSSDYFSETFLNHNTSLDLNVSLKNSDITFSVTELITGVSLSDFFFTIDGITKNGNESFYLKAGSYNVTANSTSYFDLVKEINVTSLQNNTINLDGAFNGIINVNVTDRINDIAIQNFSGVYSYNLLGLNISLGSFSTTNYTYPIPALSNYTFYVDLDTISGLSTFGDNAEFNVGAKEIINYTFLLYTNNSINFSFQDLDTLNSLVQNVNITMVGSTVTYNFSTGTGFLYVDDLNDDTYKTTFVTSGYDPVILYLTVGNNGHLNTVVSFASGLTSKTFNVQDNNLNPVSDATITFYVNINGTQTVFGQTKTDFSGTSTILLDESLEYTFIAQKNSYVTFTGSVVPTEPSYTITLNTVGEDVFTSVFDDVVYTPTFFYDPVTGVINSSFIVSSSEGSLEFFGLFTNYSGSLELFNVSSSPQGGIATVTLFNVTEPSNRTIVFTYFFKSSGYDIFSFNQSYYLSNITVNSTSLTGGLFQDIENLDPDEPVRGFLGAGFVLIGVLLFIGASRNFTVGVIGGILAVGVNWYFGIWPAATSLITIIIAVILLIADNSRG